MTYILVLLPFGTRKKMQDKVEMALALLVTHGNLKLLPGVAQITFASQWWRIGLPAHILVSVDGGIEDIRVYETVFETVARKAGLRWANATIYKLRTKTIFGPQYRRKYPCLFLPR